MAQDEYVIQKRYTLRGKAYSGSFPVTVTDYIHCPVLLNNIRDNKLNDLRISEEEDQLYLEFSSLIQTFDGSTLVTSDLSNMSLFVNTGITNDIVL